MTAVFGASSLECRLNRDDNTGSSFVGCDNLFDAGGGLGFDFDFDDCRDLFIRDGMAEYLIGGALVLS